MALITRISRLFKADLHAVLDHVEEPDLMLRQSLREMEASFSSDERQLKLLKHELLQLKNRSKKFEESLEKIDGELDICFSSKQNDLARGLIRRKLEVQRHLELIDDKERAISQVCSTLEHKLKEQGSQLESMRQKAELLSEESTSSGEESNWRFHEPEIGDDEIEIAFLKEQQKRRQS